MPAKLATFFAGRWLYGFIIAAVLLVIGYVGVRAYSIGRDSCQLDQLEAQLEREREIRDRFEEIDNETPFDADRATKLEWLQQFVRD